MSDKDISRRFLERLSARDFDGLATLFAPGAQARFLLPRGPETQLGGADIATRFRDWFAAASEFTVRSTEVDEIGGRERLGWELQVVRGGPPEEIQQVAFIDAGADGILRLDLLCSGFHPVAADPVACEVAVFDAGDLGCADGLADEFRRRLAAVPVGSSLQVIAADPAAREDLPPLARMLGHTVKATGTLPDGRFAISVERGR